MRSRSARSRTAAASSSRRFFHPMASTCRAISAADTIRKRVPIMGLSEQYVRAGALFALVSSYTENGRQAAERLRMVAQGKDPGKIPVGRPERLEVVFNARTAENLNVRLRGVPYARQRPVR